MIVVFIVPHHRVSFTAACLPIHENRTIDTTQTRQSHSFDDTVVNIDIVVVCAEAIVKIKRGLRAHVHFFRRHYRVELIAINADGHGVWYLPYNLLVTFNLSLVQWPQAKGYLYVFHDIYESAV